MRPGFRALVALLALAALAPAAAAAGVEAIDGVEAKVRAMVVSYEGGAEQAAVQERRDAYLTFEEVEAQLRARDPALTRDVEAILGQGGSLDTMLQARTPSSEVRAEADRLVALLPAVRARLAGGSDPGVVFGQSLFIMVREGFEAILVVAALAGYLRVSGHADRLRTVYAFAGLALVASFLTAAVFALVTTIGAVNRETLEGVTGIVAVIVLFYVSYWLLSKVETAKWMAFIKSKMRKALESKDALALGGVSFLAVYREGFETVLFYQALAGSAQTGAAQTGLLAGIAIGAAVLAAIFIALYKFGVKIPMREFFAVTGVLLYYLAFTFAGNAVHELQEAGALGATALAGLPTVDLIGFHPTVETLAAQLLLVFAAVFALLYIFVMRPAAERLAAPAARAASE